MTERPALSIDVLRFLDEKIDTVPHLETLLLMSESPRAWPVGEIATQVYVTHERAQVIVDELVRRKLLAPAEISQYYEFKPADDRDRLLVDELGRVYRANLRLVATIIHEKASGSIREFARAFELKKDR
jgi:hypothetical protein